VSLINRAISISKLSKDSIKQKSPKHLNEKPFRRWIGIIEKTKRENSPFIRRQTNRRRIDGRPYPKIKTKKKNKVCLTKM
jgi:hypothetical protein